MCSSLYKQTSLSHPIGKIFTNHTDWNVYQRTCISHTFQQAILGFLLSPHDPLRYTWMRFLPRGIKHPFWKPVEQRIWKLIQESDVLESRAKSLHRPGTLERLLEDGPGPRW